jgi:hypothetical protein
MNISDKIYTEFSLFFLSFFKKYKSWNVLFNETIAVVHSTRINMKLCANSLTRATVTDSYNKDETEK